MKKDLKKQRPLGKPSENSSGYLKNTGNKGGRTGRNTGAGLSRLQKISTIKKPIQIKLTRFTT
ncbi:hypothetical protein [Kingella potus]|uniref:hypothetical protein n=1 Tax=Kingella potus TaxID=265175 RepID=UPI000E1BD151